MLILAAFAGCGRSPAAPLGPLILNVGIVDATTGQRLTDSAFGIVLHATGPVTIDQPAVNGAATFSSLPRGTYTLTATADFAYQANASVPINLLESTSFEYGLKPVDDAIVTEVFVDGQGPIPRGGIIDVPLSGVTLHFRGRYQSPSSPWPAQNIFDISPHATGFSAYSIPFTGPRAVSQWEQIWGNWNPCGETGGVVRCSTSSESLFIYMGTPASRSFPSQELRTRLQSWPLNYRVAPGCCPRP